MAVLVNLLLLGALFLAAASVAYLMFRVTKEEHETREYAWTWAIAIGILFFMGIGPALVGVGLYLAVERGYPFYWLLLFAAGGLVIGGILAVVGLGLYGFTDPVVEVESSAVSNLLN